MIITSYSDFNRPLNEYPKKLKGRLLHRWVKGNLRDRERVSVFELGEDYRMARTIQYLESIGSVKLDNKSMQYPYLEILN